MVRKLNKETIELVEKEIKEYIRLSDILKLTKYADDTWFKHRREWAASFVLLQTLTGLSDKRLNDLIAGRTNTATYWLPNGEIRKDH